MVGPVERGRWRVGREVTGGGEREDGGRWRVGREGSRRWCVGREAARREGGREGAWGGEKAEVVLGKKRRQRQSREKKGKERVDTPLLCRARHRPNRTCRAVQPDSAVLRPGTTRLFVSCWPDPSHDVLCLSHVVSAGP